MIIGGILLILEWILASGATALGSVKVSDFAFIKLTHYAHPVSIGVNSIGKSIKNQKAEPAKMAGGIGYDNRAGEVAHLTVFDSCG